MKHITYKRREEYNYERRSISQFYPKYNRKTMDIMKRAVYVLRLAHIYAQRVDWMLSGDDGEDSLVERLEKELAELKKKYPKGKFTFNLNNS